MATSIHHLASGSIPSKRNLEVLLDWKYVRCFGVFVQVAWLHVLGTQTGVYVSPDFCLDKKVSGTTTMKQTYQASKTRPS